MIGLSLSLCVKDIVENKVNINEVEKIIVNIDIYDKAKWNDLLIMYCNYCWDNYDEQAIEICNILKSDNRIEYHGDNHHVLLYKHHWVDKMKDIEYTP